MSDRLPISRPGQCCVNHCVEDIDLHNVDRSSAEAVVAKVTEREAAARREALLEAAEEHRAEVERLTKSVGAFSAARDAAKEGWQETKDRVARVEALAAGLQEQYEASDYSETASLGEIAEAIRAALAEPERDEEGGR